MTVQLISATHRSTKTYRTYINACNAAEAHASLVDANEKFRFVVSAVPNADGETHRFHPVFFLTVSQQHHMLSFAHAGFMVVA